VINGELGKAVEELRSIIIAYRCQFKVRQKEFSRNFEKFSGLGTGS